MFIEIKSFDLKTWSVCIHQKGIRGYIGNPFFACESSAKMAAEGIRFCFSRIGIIMSSNYSQKNPVMPKNEKEMEWFSVGMKIYSVSNSKR